MEASLIRQSLQRLKDHYAEQIPQWLAEMAAEDWRTYQPAQITDEEAIKYLKESDLRFYEEQKERALSKGRTEWVRKAPECFLRAADSLLLLSKDTRRRKDVLATALEYPMLQDLADALLFYGESWRLRFTGTLEANGVPPRVIKEILEAIDWEYALAIQIGKIDLSYIKSDPERCLTEAALEHLPEYLAEMYGDVR